ncbi:hypothetical protein [Burkholderia plantarii]|nr:hypothetical protein [Burkholderia plantarii]MBI0330490.1 hypothetical protein [Burkholderia plantarii]
MPDGTVSTQFHSRDDFMRCAPFDACAVAMGGNDIGQGMRDSTVVGSRLT